MISPKPKTVLELYEGHPERWTTATPARALSGKAVAYDSPEAVCWCLLGATAYVGEPYQRNEKLYKTTECSQGIIIFNDDATFSQILDVVRRAGI